MTDLASLYRHRFQENELAPKRRIWETLCQAFFQKFIPETATVLDVACGYGEFINAIECRKKLAIDLNPDTPNFLAKDINFYALPADNMSALKNNSVDIAFTSNFLEHLPSKEVLTRVFSEINRVLKVDGKFIVMGPNIKYLYAEYWDFIDHHLPLSHLSLIEALQLGGFEIETAIDKFLPYTTQSRLPQSPFLVAIYLKFPVVWRILGKQFLVVARKPSATTNTPKLQEKKA
ncbi:MAG: class I SAM-dependent methyltransferase [Spongiibacteraceae bacterium]